jgi:hypothetical protein
MSMQEYLDLPAVSAGLITDVLDCPARAWWNSWLNPNRVRETSPEMDAGTIAHAVLLEGNADCCAVIDPEDHPAEKTGAIPVGWTNKSIRAARDAARESGKIPILKQDIAEISAMVASALEFIDSLKETEPAIYAAFQTDGGESELTFTWDDGPTPCRIRPDRISTDHKLVVDAKFTSIEGGPRAWIRTQLFSMGYDTSAAFYSRGIEQIYGVVPTYIFLVVPTKLPCLPYLVGLDPRSMDLAAQKVSLGLMEWKSCAKADSWPSYPRVVHWAEAPAWMEAQIEVRQMDDPWRRDK